MSTQPRTEQIRERVAKPMIGSAANDTVDTLFTKIDAQTAKLFEDRNLLLADGGTIAVNSGGTSVTFSASLKLHVNSLVSGATPSIIDLGATTRAFTADGRMLYAVINRVAATATVTADSATLPAVVAANQEVVLIAKRIGTTIYFRNGVTVPASASRTMDGNIFTTNALTVNQSYAEGISDDNTSGSNVTLATPTTPIIRLTNATLVSVDMIPAGVTGQSYKYINATGATVNFNNLTGGTAANQILTGTNGTLPVANNASIIITYDGTSTKNRIIGGSGSGGSGSGINYILSPSADTGTSGWVTYADAAAVSPVDGTGGAPNVTFTTTATTPLRGSASFLFTKDAANRQGQGFSYDFTIDNADKGKVLQGYFEYLIASGIFADNDMSMWIYYIDGGNSKLIQPAPYLIKNSGIIEKFGFEFQTEGAPSSTNTYRLIFHVASTSALAYTIKLDTIAVGPQAKLYGSPLIDDIAFTPTGTFTTNTVYTGMYSKHGDKATVKQKISFTGAPNAATLSINVPPGLTIDTTKIADLTSGSRTGFGYFRDSATGFTTQLRLRYATATTFTLELQNAAGTFVTGQGDLTNTSPKATIVNGDHIVLEYTFPVLGWSSSQIMSADANTRVVDFVGRGTGSTQALTANVTNVSATVIKDSHTAWTGSTYVVPTPGDYQVSAFLFSAASSTLFQSYVNGVANKYVSWAVAANGGGGSTTIPDLKAGDIISIRSNASVTLAADVNQHISISKISGPAQIAASESVNCRFSTAAGQSIANASTPIVNFGTIDYDSHGAVTTGASWKFTAPMSGKYHVSVGIIYNTASFTLAGQEVLRLYKNNVQFAIIGYMANQASGTYFVRLSGSDTVSLLAGDFIDVRTDHTEASARALTANGAQNSISINRVGN